MALLVCGQPLVLVPPLPMASWQIEASMKRKRKRVPSSRREPGRSDSTFERVIRAGKAALPEDTTELARQVRVRDFVPHAAEREHLFTVASAVNLVTVVEEVFGPLYTTWLDTDATDRDRKITRLNS